MSSSDHNNDCHPTIRMTLILLNCGADPITEPAAFRVEHFPHLVITWELEKQVAEATGNFTVTRDAPWPLDGLLFDYPRPPS